MRAPGAMVGIARRSVAARRPAFAATAIAVLLGTTLLFAFLTLLQSGLAGDVSSEDRTTLTMIAAVVGGWSIVIVLFSVVSTLGVMIARRTEELSLLRTVALTRRQVRRMVVGETLIVSLSAAVAGLAPGALVGFGVLRALAGSGLISDGVGFHVGTLSIGSSLAAMTLAAAVAATFAARRATAAAGAEQMRAALADAQRGRLGRKRKRFALGLVALGVVYASVTITVTGSSDDYYAAMSTAGSASVFASIGLALLAPGLLRIAAGAASRLGAGDVSRFLALRNARQRPGALAGALMPVIVLVGIATGTLIMVSVDAANGMLDAGGPGDQGTELLNYLVVGMISLFAAIMVVNTLTAAVADRRRELALQRLAGSTRGQVERMVVCEALLIAVVGIAVGLVGSLATTVPYMAVKHTWILATGAWLFAAVAAVALTVTVGAARLAVRRVVAEAPTRELLAA
ncbi:MAG TPA: FtsX-like permease family protein [Solirubrobacter sp.]|nr:FtsX-like permease family protein [Solirubrobacter sp.]